MPDTTPSVAARGVHAFEQLAEHVAAHSEQPEMVEAVRSVWSAQLGELAPPEEQPLLDALEHLVAEADRLRGGVIHEWVDCLDWLDLLPFNLRLCCRPAESEG